ncbi:oxygen-independent coproporphyrinogen III oxidase [Marimonas sp. MJW-29]|uniref:Coproporphyrinogen-III oxidase n=1 Tax=Sulfitobacter sediminis TaxID=3234186 RepID=A0ABV3RQM4_9RHOB
MLSFDDLKARGLFDERLPRYTSYPPAPAFHDGMGAAFQAEALAALDPGEPISLYLHIPFCERLCWFCACRTQGVRSIAPVEHYIGTLEAELALIKDHLPGRIRVGQMHWGGGTPTILPPALITRLRNALGTVFDFDPDTEFSVEIDPTLVDADKVVALREAGMTRASIGVQDFAEVVQNCIGRLQSFEQTRDAVDLLRAAGIGSLNIDLVYGLPFQSITGFGKTLDQVCALDPDRIALFGYAHVPHMAQRQKLIPEAALPDDRARFALFNKATEMLTAHGLAPIGIDHFAKPGDSMAQAARTGHLRRNFQGYTVDGCETLLGLGASSISKFRDGFVQNTAQTGPYTKLIKDGSLAGARGYRLTEEDRLRSRVIEMLMCDYAIDFEELALSAADMALLAPGLAALRAECRGLITESPGRLSLSPEARPLVRRLAHFFDTFTLQNVGFSRVS